jgi:hypothetical protein
LESSHPSSRPSPASDPRAMSVVAQTTVLSVYRPPQRPTLNILDRETSFGRDSPFAKTSQPIPQTKRQVQPAPGALLRAKTSRPVVCAMSIQYTVSAFQAIQYSSRKRKWAGRPIARAKDKYVVISLDAFRKVVSCDSFKPQMSTRGCDRLDCGGREYACSPAAREGNPSAELS